MWYHQSTEHKRLHLIQKCLGNGMSGICNCLNHFLSHFDKFAAIVFEIHAAAIPFMPLSSRDFSSGSQQGAFTSMPVEFNDFGMPLFKGHALPKYTAGAVSSGSSSSQARGGSVGGPATPQADTPLSSMRPSNPSKPPV
jgi:hypothetical protein